jgi:AcrR family transcriptional regulator
MDGKKAAQSVATKRKLLLIARKLFAARGFSGVSAEEIVAAANVTRGALYHQYDGKTGLFEAVVEAVMQELHAKIVKETVTVADPLQALEIGVGVFLKASSDLGVQQILFVDAPATLGWLKWRAMDSRYGLGLLKRALAAAMEAGLLRRQDVDLLAHVLMGALTETAILIASSTRQTKARADAARLLTSMIAAWRIKA